MRIAVIGWGSLVWDPGNLDVETEWRAGGPMLAVEFGRFSSRERLTLVLEGGAPPQRTLWTLSRKETLAAAVADLRVREGTTRANIGFWGVGNAGAYQAGVVAEIHRWATELELDGAVWTALGPNNLGQESGLATSDARVSYLKKLVASGKESAAREYVEKAPRQVDTPLRRRIRDELGWR